MSDSPPPEVELVFIVGSRRSGTTWIALLLGQREGVVVLQQSSFFDRVRHLLDWLGADRTFGRTVLTKSGGGGEGAAGLSRLPIRDMMSLEKFREHLAPLARDTYRQFGACVPEAVAVVDQQPENLLGWEHIHAFFPRAWFVHVIRDPRSVYSSYVHAARSWSNPRTFTCDPIDFAEEWKRDVEKGRAIAAATDRRIEVRYEDLREKGAVELQRIYAALGFEADLETCQQAIDACSVDKLKTSGHGPRGFFRRGEVAGWRREVSRGRLAALEYSCADLMDELGYQRVHRAFERPPLRHRLRERRREMQQWMKGGDGALRSLARGVVRVVPGLRRLVWKIFRK